ncbi:MAG: nuclear transport factor 2 family protein [Parvularculaceae bacterium]
MKVLTGSIAALATLIVAASAFAQGQPSYSELSATAGEVSDSYFESYVARDWDRIENLIADNVRTEDPTARDIFGSVARVGKTEVMKGFREGFSSISAMNFDRQRVLHSGEYGIFEGVLHWTIDVNGVEVTSATPIVTVVRVVNGKVSEHYDYVDYQPFFTSLKAAREAAAQK